MVVVAPKAVAVAALRELKTEMRAGVAAMATEVRNHISSTNHAALAELDRLTNDAQREIDKIDQTLDETEEQRLNRLGLGPATLALARRAV
jgi:hypothetical protein